MEINLIGFNVNIGQKKPENIIHREAPCPFCDREHLTDIIATDGDIILLKNKYNVIEEAEQFVIIESAACTQDMPDYTDEFMERLLDFSLRHWRRMLDDERYETVLFFKNYGPLSGGTIRHPHMQLVGFYKGAINPGLLFSPEEFTGYKIADRDDVEFNISTCPRIGFGELNIVPSPGSSVSVIARYLKIAVDYLKNHFRRNSCSYNVFFYPGEGDRMYIKLMPRFATSPLFIGYNIHFRPNNIRTIADEIQRIYKDLL